MGCWLHTDGFCARALISNFRSPEISVAMRSYDESTEIGFRIRGIEPPDLGRYPPATRKLFWSWVVESGLKRKDYELSKGWNKDGAPMKRLTPESIKYRKSEVGPTDKNAPPLEPSHSRSRVRSLLIGRAHTDSAEFWWGFDAVTGESFAVILRAQREKFGDGRDVFGVSDRGIELMRSDAWKKWEQWKRAQHAGLPAQTPRLTGRQHPRYEVPKRPVKGRLDLENLDIAGPVEPIKRAIEAGRFSGFRRLNLRGEQWKPGPGIGPAPAGPVPKPAPKPKPAAPPKPKPAPRPAAIPVSAAMDVRADSPQNQASCRSHACGDRQGAFRRELESSPHREFQVGKGLRRLHQCNHQDKKTRVVSMEINRAADHPHMTIAHETGHVLDYAGIPRTADQLGSQRDFRKEELFKDFIKAVDESESIKTLRAREFEEKFGKYPLDQHHMAYLLQDHEIWARAYSQWIALKSGDLDMFAELEHSTDSEEARRFIAPQWTTEDFRPIAAALDNIFRKLGWLK